MKGKLSIILLSALCSAILLTGCGDSDNTSGIQTPPTPAETTSSAADQESSAVSEDENTVSNTEWKLTGCTNEDGASMTDEQIQEQGGGSISFGSNNICQITIFGQSLNATYVENDGNIILTIGNETTVGVMENQTISMGWGGANLIFTLQ